MTAFWKEREPMRSAIPCLLVAFVMSPAALAGTIFDYISPVNAATAPTLPLNPPGFVSSTISIGNGNSLTFTTNAPSMIDGGIPGGADINFGTIIFNASANAGVVTFGVNFNY